MHVIFFLFGPFSRVFVCSYVIIEQDERLTVENIG